MKSIVASVACWNTRLSSGSIIRSSLAGLASILLLSAVPGTRQALGFLPSWWGHFLRLVLVACSVMLIPTVLMGLLFPLAGRIHAAGSVRRNDVAAIEEVVRRVYAVDLDGLDAEWQAWAKKR